MPYDKLAQASFNVRSFRPLYQRVGNPQRPNLWLKVLQRFRQIVQIYQFADLCVLALFNCPAR